jgi:hypothetical protein
MIDRFILIAFGFDGNLDIPWQLWDANKSGDINRSTSHAFSRSQISSAPIPPTAAMKLLTSLALTVPLLASSAYGHCKPCWTPELYQKSYPMTTSAHFANSDQDIFQFLTANGQRGSQYQYIRPNSNYNSPVTDLNSPDLRCNVGGGSGGSTATVEVRAGSSISFHSDTAVYHQGPTSMLAPPLSRNQTCLCKFSADSVSQLHVTGAIHGRFVQRCRLMVQDSRVGSH